MDLAAHRRCVHQQPYRCLHKPGLPSVRTNAKYRRTAQRVNTGRVRLRQNSRSTDNPQEDYIEEEEQVKQPAGEAAGRAAGKQAAACQQHASVLPAGAALVAQRQLVLQQLYARRNADVVQALHMLGQSVQVEQPAPMPAAPAGVDLLLQEDSFASNYLSDAEDVEPKDGSTGTGNSGDNSAAQDTWLEDEGWEMRTSPSGEVFLERGVRAKPQQSQQAAAKSSAASAAPQRQVGTTKQQSAAGAAAAAASRAAPRTKQSVGIQQSQGDQHGASSASASASQQSAARRAPAGEQELPCVLQPPQLLHPGLKPALRTLRLPEQILDFASLLYPIWAAAGCRLAAPGVLAAPQRTSATKLSTASTPRLGVAPSPVDAAVILQAVALAVKREGWSQARRLQLCLDTRITGLMEALRVRPPRLSPDQDASPALRQALMSVFSTAAKKWWLSMPKHTAHNPAGSLGLNGSSTAAGPAAQQGNTTGTGLNGFHLPHISGLNGHASTPAPGSVPLQPPCVDSSSASSSSQQPNNSSNGNGTEQTGKVLSAYPDQQYVQILGKYLNGSSDGDAVKAVRGVRHQAIVASLWSMAALGGASCWQEEMGAVLRVAGGGATDWHMCGPGDAGSVAWALASSRHWSSQLSKLAAALGQASGGNGSWLMAPDEIVRLLWGYATLNHPLTGLPLPHDWAWQQGTSGGDVRDFSAAQLAGCCWALAVRNVTHHPAFTTAWHELLSRPADVASAGSVVLTQVWQVALELKSCGAAVTAPDPATAHNAIRGAAAKKASTDSVTQTINVALCTWMDWKTRCQQDVQPPEDVWAEQQQAQSQNEAQARIATPKSKAVQATEALLQAAAKAFLQGSRAVRGEQAGKGWGATAGAATHSSYQRQMGNALVALRHMHVVEDVTTGYAVDLSLPLLKVAIEVDGPSHYSRVPGPNLASSPVVSGRTVGNTVRQHSHGTTSWPLGATAMKRRHVQALGWALVSISTEEWDIAGSPAAQQALLKQRIEAAVQDRLEIAMGHAVASA